MSSCSALDALELLPKGVDTCRTLESPRRLLRAAVGLDGAQVVEPSLRMNRQAGGTLLVRVDGRKLQRWVIQ